MIDANDRDTRSAGGVILLALSVLLIGIAQIAMLPPFEGLDEVGHYSSIRQIVATGTIPMLGHSFIAPEAIDYRAYGPSPYNMPISTVPGAKPQNSDMISYADFANDPDLKAKYFTMYRLGNNRVPYAAVTDEFNWEAQHPPLYYLLMAPVMRATDSMPPVTQFFILRLISFLMAFAGLLIGVRATLRYLGEAIPPRYIAAAFLLYPLCVPMFYPEFGRLGNDGLCLLLFGIIWHLTLIWRSGKTKAAHELALGLCFGLGLLTKAFFLPILGGFFVQAVLWIWHERSQRKMGTRLQGILLTVGIALIIGGWWYVIQFLHTGSAIGSLDSVMLKQGGGLVAGLVDKFSPAAFAADLAFSIRTWSWYGTGSFTTVIILAQAPILALSIVLFIIYALSSRGTSYASVRWIPFWFAAPFFAGLVWHILVCEASAFNITPGWYLSIVMPLFATAMAYGLSRLAAYRVVLGLFLLYAAGFLIFVFWAQASLFAGCAVKGSDKLYDFPNHAFCLDRYHAVAANLAVLAWPCASLLTFGAGLMCLVLGVGKVRLFAAQKSFE